MVVGFEPNHDVLMDHGENDSTRQEARVGALWVVSSPWLALRRALFLGSHGPILQALSRGHIGIDLSVVSSAPQHIAHVIERLVVPLTRVCSFARATVTLLRLVAPEHAVGFRFQWSSPR